MANRKLKIINHGQNAWETRIIDMETQEEISWDAFKVVIDASTSEMFAVIAVHMPVIDITTEGRVEEVCPCCKQKIEKEKNLNL